MGNLKNRLTDEQLPSRRTLGPSKQPERLAGSWAPCRRLGRRSGRLVAFKTAKSNLPTLHLPQTLAAFNTTKLKLPTLEPPIPVPNRFASSKPPSRPSQTGLPCSTHHILLNTQSETYLDQVKAAYPVAQPEKHTTNLRTSPRLDSTKSKLPTLKHIPQDKPGSRSCLCGLPVPLPSSPRRVEVGEIEAKDGLPSADRNNKATLLLTGPFRTAKSSAKDLTPLVLKLQYAKYHDALRAPWKNRLLRR